MDTPAPIPVATKEAFAEMSRRAAEVAKSFDRLHQALETLLGVLSETNHLPSFDDYLTVQQAIARNRGGQPRCLSAFAEAEGVVCSVLERINKMDERSLGHARDMHPSRESQQYRLQPAPPVIIPRRRARSHRGVALSRDSQQYYPQPSPPVIFPRLRVESHGDLARFSWRQHHAPIYKNQPLDALQRGMRSDIDGARAHDGIQRRKKKRSRHSLEVTSQEVEHEHLVEADSAPATFKIPRFPGAATSIEHGEANGQ